MNDTTKYLLFGLAILLAIMIPSIVRFFCIERCNRNKTQYQAQYQVQYDYNDIEHTKPIYTQA